MKLSEIKGIAEAAFVNGRAKRVVSRDNGAGTLRGAMGGVVYPDGVVISSKCPRLDQARFRGVEAEAGKDSPVVFSAGFGHEVFLQDMFKGGGYDVIDCSKEIPIKLEPLTGATTARVVYREQSLASTVDVDGEAIAWRGTPDFLVWDGARWHGIEAKCEVSNFGVAKGIRSGWPQRKHALQTATYMTVLNFDEWIIAVGHYFYAMADGDKMDPQVRYFRMFRTTVVVKEGEILPDGQAVPPTEAVRFAVENEQGEVHVLDFGPSEVLAYQKLIIKAERANVLATRPKWKEVFPKRSAYNECNYCSAKMDSECNRADVGKLDYAGWLERLKNKSK